MKPSHKKGKKDLFLINQRVNGLISLAVFSVDVVSFDKFGYVFPTGDSSDTGLVSSGVVAFFDVFVFSVDSVASLPEPSGAEFAGGG